MLGVLIFSQLGSALFCLTTCWYNNLVQTWCGVQVFMSKDSCAVLFKNSLVSKLCGAQTSFKSCRVVWTPVFAEVKLVGVEAGCARVWWCKNSLALVGVKLSWVKVWCCKSLGVRFLCGSKAWWLWYRTMSKAARLEDCYCKIWRSTLENVEQVRKNMVCLQKLMQGPMPDFTHAIMQEKRLEKSRRGAVGTEISTATAVARHNTYTGNAGRFWIHSTKKWCRGCLV